MTKNKKIQKAFEGTLNLDYPELIVLSHMIEGAKREMRRTMVIVRD